MYLMYLSIIASADWVLELCLSIEGSSENPDACIQTDVHRHMRSTYDLYIVMLAIECVRGQKIKEIKDLAGPSLLLVRPFPACPAFGVR